MLFLTGIFARFTGTPGFIQSHELQVLLETKLKEVTLVEREIQDLQEEFRELRSNTDIQEYEVRRVLGYAAPDELIFDFTSTKR